MKKKPIYLILTILLGLAYSFTSGQAKPGKMHGQLFRVVFYNVENLFDTIDDPAKNDADFLPGSRIAWTMERYQAKLDRLSQVISAMAGDKPAAVIGVCEVENKDVLNDLVASPAILKYQYQVIHRESPDERGIDNALLYDPEQFRPASVRAIPVDITSFGEDHTRDILYVKGVTSKNKTDTLHIFVNHWPSRSEGKEVSEPKRLVAAHVLKEATDSLIALNNHPLIIIMGDFNDEPSDKSLTEGLGAFPPSTSIEPAKLYNLGYPPFQQGKGTLYYKDWDLFDQVIVNGAFLMNTKGITVPFAEEGIFSPDWLLYKNNDGTLRPNRTAAKEYYGGYSDHLPVYLDMMILK
jgi:endonuclease/exonuclease/phosphatase family metal-dependent hydrolase